MTAPTRTISTSLFVSLDGVVQADDDWQFPFLDDATFSALTADWSRSDAALLGRRTFEGFRDVRDSAPDSPVVGFLQSVTRHVVAGRGFDPRWDGTRVIAVDDVETLKRADGANILVIGSPTLVRWLLDRRLVDSFAVVVLPIVVGSGPRLTTDTSQPALHRVPFDLVGSRPLDSGAIHLTYRPKTEE